MSFQNRDELDAAFERWYEGQLSTGGLYSDKSLARDAWRAALDSIGMTGDNVIQIGSAIVKDAQRYRWLRDRAKDSSGYPMVVVETVQPTGVYIKPADPEKLDALIDEARAKAV